MAPKPDPFQKWRDQQRATSTTAATDPPETGKLHLSPGREARLDLAILEFVDAVRAPNPDQDEISAAGQRMIDLRHQLHAEQAAELGYMPTTADGCIAVLNVAAGILELLGPDDIEAILTTVHA